MRKTPKNGLAKGRHLEVAEQEIVLDQAGRVLESDDAIISTKKIGDLRLFEPGAFLASVFEHLFFSKENPAELVLSCIQMAAPELPGMYDLHFFPIFLGPNPALRCIIFDRTAHYSTMREAQQIEMERALTLEKSAFTR